ncbi:MAG: ABC transporter permease [Fuerstia sp.]|nr:ABC transporter permease [Fuerstiella sp.]
MQKILTIARREYQAMVATKAFVIGIALMPVMMLGGMWIPGLLKGMERAEDRRIAIVDRSGQLFEPLKKVAIQRNQMLQAATAEPSSPDAANGTNADGGALKTLPRDKEKEADQQARKAMGLEEIHRYLLESVPAEEFGDEQRLALSERIRSGDLYAFVEIPADVLLPQPLDPLSAASLQLPEITYVAQDSALADAKRWVDTALNQLIRANRLTTAGVAPIVLLELERKAPVVGSGLYVRDEAGRITSEKKPNELASIFLPMGLMMLMFMIVMMSAQPMLESVLEEKTLRISEVLLGSANARQLMTGKLLGNVAGSLTVFALYAGGGLTAAYWKGYSDSIPFHILPWFVIYLLLAVLLFSSIFMAIAASVSQLREAQGLLLPVWMVMLLPMFVWFNVVREPNSTLATALSFFPPSTPLMMTLRLATGAIIPGWQIAMSFALLILATVVGVTAAAKIYRIGILWQGKTPKLTELLMWLIRNPTSARN